MVEMTLLMIVAGILIAYVKAMYETLVCIQQNQAEAIKAISVVRKQEGKSDE